MKSSPINELKTVTTNKLPSSFTRGPQIGTYKGYAIFAWLKDNHGILRIYKGLSTSDDDLLPGSIIATPGLLYEPSSDIDGDHSAVQRQPVSTAS